ncbi:shikimate dehydrogenase [Cohaesibacter sp. ES.047]|uniref:shikimate dehydrogenase n=1 Tax=Cohaesibacter sp. ES.047 TaxID=1798205 RepID=UPI000BB78A49|nr:shikimate dehydrogenase [Cohaesibacter sp. ES.047]SNY90516.1 shikimate dehydrogenase [Cohaesibacter sp. ES.047]
MQPSPRSQQSDLIHSAKAFVIGWPISHSKSPAIHSHWLETYGLIGSYEKIAVEPDKLESFIKGLADNGFVGGNVTIPHKETVLSLVDVVHPTAKRLGAANTLWLEDGKIHADNTDGYGFLANLDHGHAGWDKNAKSKALVLGAGGAARPIVHGLIERGFEKVTVVNRTRQRAEALALHFDALDMGKAITVADWDERESLLEDIDLLVNTSSLGMSGQPSLELDLAALPRTALVTDIVYTPLITGLLETARDRGNPIVDGLGMLLHQAVPGFERWFGTRPEVTDDVRTLVLGQDQASS